MADDNKMFSARVNAQACSAVGMPDGRVLLTIWLDSGPVHATATPGDCLRLIGDLSRGAAKAIQGMIAT